MEDKRTNISVVIPCYNEGKIINDTIKSLKLFFKNNDCLFNYELIFVDDGSTDDTGTILEKDNDIRKHIYQTNKGKGYAVKQGLLKAKYENIMLLDCDLSVRPNEIYQIKGLDDKTKSFIVKGQRVQVKSQPIHRLIAGWGFRTLTNMILNININDTQCPFWIFHNINKGLFKGLKINGFSFDCELLFKAKQLKLDVKKLDVDYFNNEDSSVKLKHYFIMLYELLRIRFFLKLI